MSTCISRHGEYSTHTLGETGDDRFICELCHEFDEAAALARIADLEATLAADRQHAAEERPAW